MGFNTVFDESRIDTKLFSDVTDDLVNANNQSVVGLIRLDLPNLSHAVRLTPLPRSAPTEATKDDPLTPKVSVGHAEQPTT